MVFNLVGRLIGVTLGLMMMIIGVILTITFFGVAIGVPLIILGLLLMIRLILKW